MLHRDDHDYFWVRAAEELEHGKLASDATVAAVHYELAYRYGALASQTCNATPKLALVHG